MAGRRSTADQRTPASGDHRRRQARGIARRQQIVEAAARVFAERGARGADIAAIAAEVGMTPPGLLYYFGSKERLLLEVAEERHRARAVDPATPATLREMRDSCRFNAEHRTLTELYAVLAAESFRAGSPLHDFFVQRHEGSRAYLRDVLRWSIDAGELRADIDVEALAAEIAATSLGLEIQWLTDPDRIDLGARLEAYLDRLLTTLVPVEPRRDDPLQTG